MGGKTQKLRQSDLWGGQSDLWGALHPGVPRPLGYLAPGAPDLWGAPTSGVPRTRAAPDLWGTSPDCLHSLNSESPLGNMGAVIPLLLFAFVHKQAV